MSSAPAATDMPHHFLHIMIRVGNLERSIAFYCEGLGLRELRREDYPGGRFTLVFLGFGDETDHTVIELTYNYGEAEYSHGTGFGHLAFAVADISKAFDRLTSRGARLLRAPGPMTHTATNGQREVIAFVEDPDGYRIELIQTPARVIAR